ncbi:YheV family putative metal-binding protein [Marinomonas hwangdonensis]|uniref:YheV family putative metal-binding protein n=1 Tax=Marinomonas hwangdonensis TaxID=1053647 RepID=A0A3M8Q8C0_9GAMM|nr:YheV family putative zinc ribbon protein [Marinomonas hwangdonensis]MDP5055282.1 YheV family putative metal-binding protein [Marinomonas hwangdonensis]RNF51524.1 YheV family putative metal-binding protein [Marinomonas hwangdonensis]
MTVKRFIAGVVCPRCSEMDKIRAWRDDEVEKQYRECISCGYTDEQSTVVQAQPTEIPTRVNKPHSSAPQAEEMVINFIPNPGMTKH